MIQEKKKGHWKTFVFCLFPTLFAVGLLLFPKEASHAAQNGISLCVETVIPSLFPFFVLSGIILGMHPEKALGAFAARTVCKLFGIGRGLAVAWLLGLIGGYPVGARSVCAIYRDGRCTKEEAEHVLGYANNCGPAFIISVAGIFLFQSAAAGFLLYLIHVTASLCTGILMRKTCTASGSQYTQKTPFSFTTIFVRSVKEALISAANVCAYIVLFSVLIGIANAFGLFTFLASVIAAVCGTDTAQITLPFLTGLCEVTCGIKALYVISSHTAAPVICSFLLGFGGLCVHCQTASLAAETGLSMRPYFKAKLLHGITATVLTVPFLSVIKENTRVVSGFHFTLHTEPTVFFLLCTASAGILGMIFFILSRVGKKSL